MPFKGSGITYRIGINSDFPVFGNSNYPKHGRVICFIRDFGAFQCRNMKIVNMINFLGVVHPVHIHVKISGNNYGKVGLSNYFFLEQLVTNAFLRIFRIDTLLGTMYHQYHRFGGQPLNLLKNPQRAAVFKISAIIRRCKYKGDLLIFQCIFGAINLAVPLLGIVQIPLHRTSMLLVAHYWIKGQRKFLQDLSGSVVLDFGAFMRYVANTNHKINLL